MDEHNAVVEIPIEGGVKVPQQFAQLGILAVDGSGSMTGPIKRGNIQKAQATNGAVRELFTKVKNSRVSRSFAFAVVTFDDKASVRLKAVPADNLDDNGDYNPLTGHGGGTNIYAALEEAERIANDFIAQAPPGGVPHSAVILVMSDGCCSDPARTKAIADRIKKGSNGPLVTICCAFFEGLDGTDQAGAGLLQSIASDPVMGYKTVYDGAALRDFFKASLSQASGGIEIK